MTPASSIPRPLSLGPAFRCAWQDWVVKHWYPTHGLFSNCVWLFPADQAAWFVRTEVSRAKQQGLLEESFVPQAAAAS